MNKKTVKDILNEWNLNEFRDDGEPSFEKLNKFDTQEEKVAYTDGYKNGWSDALNSVAETKILSKNIIVEGDIDFRGPSRMSLIVKLIGRGMSDEKVIKYLIDSEKVSEIAAKASLEAYYEMVKASNVNEGKIGLGSIVKWAKPERGEENDRYIVKEGPFEDDVISIKYIDVDKEFPFNPPEKVLLSDVVLAEDLNRRNNGRKI